MSNKYPEVITIRRAKNLIRKAIKDSKVDYNYMDMYGLEAWIKKYVKQSPHR